MPKISIICGGKDDDVAVKKSGMLKILENVGVSYEYSFISSDQNPDDLRKYCLNIPKTDVKIFICIAGLVPALPGAVKALLPTYSVIGVPLTTKDYKASEIMLASFSCPTKRPIIILGVNEMGLKKAAYCALEILSLSDSKLKARYERYLAKRTKKATIKAKVFRYEKTP